MCSQLIVRYEQRLWLRLRRSSSIAEPCLGHRTRQQAEWLSQLAEKESRISGTIYDDDDKDQIKTMGKVEKAMRMNRADHGHLISRHFRAL